MVPRRVAPPRALASTGWLPGLFAGNASAVAERQALVRHALNHTSETAGAANCTTSYGDGNYLRLASDRRVDGVMLESLILEQPTLDLIPKLVTGLLAHIRTLYAERAALLADPGVTRDDPSLRSFVNVNTPEEYAAAVRGAG